MGADSPDEIRLMLQGGDRDLDTLLDEAIYAFNVKATGLDDGRLMSIRAVDSKGLLVGGITGWTWGGCGYVDVLWVPEGSRRRGIGTRLMDLFEAEALTRGCAWIVLSTHTFQGPDFYRRRGYVQTGRTPEYPQGHSQLHLRKALLPAETPPPATYESG